MGRRAVDKGEKRNAASPFYNCIREQKRATQKGENITSPSTTRVTFCFFWGEGGRKMPPRLRVIPFLIFI